MRSIFSTCLMLFTFVALCQESPLETAVWTKVDANTKSSLRGLSLPSSRIVWASGTENTVILSTDKGESWKTFIVGPPETSYDFRDIWAFDSKTAWIMGAGPGKTSAIFVTRNGGDTWRQEHSNRLDNAFFDGFTFWSKRKGLIYSDPVDGVFYLLKREGKSWEKLDAEMPPALPKEASFAASGTGIFARGSNVWFGSGGAEVARVFRSENKGETWAVSETPLRAGDGAAGVFSLAFRDDLNGVAVGGKYNDPTDPSKCAAYTSDGGVTWTLASEGPRGFRSCVTYVPGRDNMLICGGTSGADYSLDDGRTWLPLGDETINTLKAANKHIAWAVGPEGNVVKLTF